MLPVQDTLCFGFWGIFLWFVNGMYVTFSGEKQFELGQIPKTHLPSLFQSWIVWWFYQSQFLLTELIVPCASS